ncbi:CocE/NonD family hydrolase [Nocardia otitidiscaviarum]|uniref:CocE/NonD family hydrolase n=1 Tax=Nocardia otitidiscaviarum TaxID=1823 RepID=UPI00189567DD|nr:CocE/NonD family hydrolase [Nocardia otitidiscaviarum]MBF6131503.1 CocE/NonD family hydrolase [Nocardia otitidiscaviarum]
MAAPITPASVPLPPDTRFDIGPERYPTVHVDTTVTIPMSDGAVLCADLTRPAYRRTEVVPEAFPVVVNFTPYNRMGNRVAGRFGRVARRAGNVVRPSDRRRFRGRDLLHTPAGGAVDVWASNRTLVSRGYADLVVDVRGTGSSTGTWDFFSPREHQDYVEVLRWIREQPWCDGHLAITGISYGGIAALIAAGQRPEGLDAVFAIVAGEDPVRELGLTGGVPTPGMAVWLAAVNAGKFVPSPRGMVRNQVLRPYLRDRFRYPASGLGLAARIATGDGHPDGFLNDRWAARLPRFEDIAAATWIHGAWHDVYNRSNFHMFDRLTLTDGAKQVLVDDGYHISVGSGFGAAGNPPALDELQCAWFDKWLKGIDNGIDGYGPVTVRRQGGGGWVSRTRFPDPAAEVRRLYLTARPSGAADHADTDASLDSLPPEEITRLPLPTGRGSLASGNTALMSLGLATLFGRRFGADDRRAEATAVTFTTEPLDSDLVLSGPLTVHLRVEAHGTDAFWSVTVTDVEPDGTSAVLTRGALLSSLRAIDEQRSRYVNGELVFPHHTLRADSVLPVVPGEPFDMDIEINATEAVLRAGHRLRVAVAPTSVPRHFLPPAVKRKINGQTIVLDPDHPSYLTYLAVSPD